MKAVDGIDAEAGVGAVDPDAADDDEYDGYEDEDDL